MANEEDYDKPHEISVTIPCACQRCGHEFDLCMTPEGQNRMERAWKEIGVDNWQDFERWQKKHALCQECMCWICMT
ncbi:MAG: hypothetical protein WAU73_19520, partial [Candidatus Sulfotelmatobacter sp.]